MTLYTQGDWLAEQPEINLIYADAVLQRKRDGRWHGGKITFEAATVMWLIDKIWDMTRERNALRQQLKERARWLAILEEAIPPCRFHGRDREGCLAYTGRVPCEVEPEDGGQ